MAEVGGTEPELDALHIRARDGGRLVTVIEIISPHNKTDLIGDYQRRRERLLQRGVNAVEIDLTRSVKRLVQDALADVYAYHVVVYLPDQAPRFIGIDFADSLIRCAIPLRAEVIAADLQPAYEHAYRQTSLAVQIWEEVQYSADALPFPSLLTPQQRADVDRRVAAWIEQRRA